MTGAAHGQWPSRQRWASAGVSASRSRRRSPAWPAHPADRHSGRPLADRPAAPASRPAHAVVKPDAPTVARPALTSSRGLGGLGGLVWQTPKLAPTGPLQVVQAVEPIDVDHPIEVVDLVLERLSQQPFGRDDADLLAVGVARLDGDLLPTGDLTPVARDRKAAFVQDVLALDLH